MEFREKVCLNGAVERPTRRQRVGNWALLALGVLLTSVSVQALPEAEGRAKMPEGAQEVDRYGRVILDVLGERTNYGQFETEEAETSHKDLDELERRAILRQRQAFQAPPSQRLSGSLPIGLEWHRGVFGYGIGSGGLEVADLDGDGVPEIVANGISNALHYWYVLHESGGVYSQVWSSLPLDDPLSQLTAMDIDGDGRDEVLISTRDRVEIYQGLDPVLSQTITSSGGTIRTFEVADVDSDGVLELILLDSANLLVYDLATGSFEYQVNGLGGYDLAAGNVDGDAEIEIAVATGSSGVVINGVTGTNEWTSPNGFGREVAVGDLDGDGIDEVATARSWNDVEVYDVDLQTLAWSTPVSHDVAALELRDVEGDGDLELVYGDAQWGDIHVHDGASGALEWQQDNPSHGITNIEFADTDLDGTLELLWGAGYSSSGADYLYVVDSVTQALEFQNLDLVGPFLGFDHGDVDADGIPELLSNCFESESGSGDGLYFVNDAVSQDLEVTGGEPTGLDFGGSWRVRQAQVDGDPQAEIFFTSGRTYDGKIFAFDGLTHLEEWQVTLESGLNFRSLEVVDVDADGDLELVAGTGRLHTGASGVYLFVYDAATGALEWQSPALSTQFASYSLLRVADVDADAALEMLVGREDGELQIFDGASHLQELNVALDLTALDTADLDGDGKDEIVIGTGSGSLEVIDPVSGTSTQTIGNFGAEIEGLAVVDLDYDGWLDFVFGAADQVRVADGLSHSLVWSSEVLGRDVGSRDSLKVADIDEDGKREVVVNTGIGFRVYQVGFVLDLPPQVTLTLPTDGAVVHVGDPVTLNGSAFDSEDGDLTASLTWSSDLDGALGDGGTLVLSDLSLGVHTITASVTDSGGQNDSVSVSIEVQDPLTVGLAGRWTLNEGTGDMAFDTSGNGYHGTLLGVPLWATGVLSGGLDMDGVGNGISFGAAPLLDQPATVTLAAWVRHDTTTDFRSIIDKRDGGSDGYDLFISNGSRLFMRVNTVTLSGNTLVADGAWHHVVGVYDGNQIHLYVDGVLDAQATAGAQNIDTAAALRIGYHFSSNDFRFAGGMDDVRIYDRALSASEVDALYLFQGTPDTRAPIRSAGAPEGTLKAGTTGVEVTLETLESAQCSFAEEPDVDYVAMVDVFASEEGFQHSFSFDVADGVAYNLYVRCADLAGNVNTDDYLIAFSVAEEADLSTGLEGYWPLDDGTGTVVTDASSNGYDCTFVDNPLWSPAQFGSGLILDGLDDGVTCGAAPLLDQPTALTLSAWIQHSPSSGFRSIIDKRDGGSDGYDLYLSNNSRLFMRVNGSTLAGSTDLDDGAWHHVVGVWDGSSLALYVDGTLDASLAVPATSIDTTAALRLGHHFANGDFRFAGSLDEARVYNRALNATEVQSLFELQLP